MKYLKPRQLKRIRELAQAGDEKAKDFLFNFFELDDDEATQYLESIKLNQVGTEEIIKKLIQEEDEAIKSYSEALAQIESADIDSLAKAKLIETITHIVNEEIEHKKELEEVI